MIGVGSAIRYVVEKNKGDTSSESYFFHALLWCIMISVIFILIGIFIPDRLVGLLGGDATIINTGKSYTRIFMLFTPFFMCNYVCNAFVRNDGAPSIAMCATLFSSLFNIVFDYILMFPLGLGMEGAALATAISPIIGILICCIHLCSGKCSVKLKPAVPSVKRLIYSCQVGVSSFVAEISSGVITIVFNMIILRLAGNIGVAAYGVVANTSLVAVALFNGIAQGSQPLISDYYGRGLRKNVGSILRMAVVSSLLIAALLILFICTFAPFVTSVFNSEHDARLASYAESGLRLYFTGFIFAGINIVGSAILSAVESVKYAFAASIMRGFIAISIFAFALSAAFGMTGVWLAFPAAEFVTMFIIVKGLRQLKL
jgi:putative MATE family efflux protein